MSTFYHPLNPKKRNFQLVRLSVVVVCSHNSPLQKDLQIFTQNIFSEDVNYRVEVFRHLFLVVYIKAPNLYNR